MLNTSVRILLAVSLCLCCLGAIGDAPLEMQQASALDSKGKLAQPDGDPGYTFHFSFGNVSYVISDNGGGVQTNESGISRKFKLPVPSGMWIGGPMYFLQYRQDYLLLYGLSDGENGAAKMVRLDPGSLSVKWAAGGIPFNITPGVVQGSSVYVTGIGFIGAIDLDTGRYGWCVTDLYQGSNVFDVFDEPQIEGTTLSTQDKLTRAADGTPYTVKVDWKKGTVATNAALAKPARFLKGCNR